MSILMYPPADAEPWPTLGPQVCAFIEEYLVFGPGDLFGKPVVLTDEDRAWFYRMYEVDPPFLLSKRGRRVMRTPNPRAGKRRFDRCVLSLRKGSAKTEKLAWIAAAELHPDGPVRCEGFSTVRGMPGQPIGRSVTDPYIPIISFSEEQAEELGFGALRRILEASPLARDLDIGLERVMRRGGDGKAEAVSSSPAARDGARTTFQGCDESHRLTLDHHRRAWSTMLANLAKRPLAEPWALETTTAPEPGGGSVAEATMDYAMRAMAGKAGSNPRLFFFHREASEKHDLETEAGLRAAILEASGPYVAKWTDVPRIAQRFLDGDADRAYLERVWLNRRTQASDKAFDMEHWARAFRPGYQPAAKAAITIGFDGSRFDDATALVGTEVETAHQFVLGLWEKPVAVDPDAPPWEVPALEVDATVREAFERWHVVRMYCDPPKWSEWVATWAGEFGEKRVVEWWTNRRKPMAYAIRAYREAMKAGELSHDGDAAMTRHLGNSCRQQTNLRDEEEERLWVLRKERPDSPHKIDLAMAGILSWEARTDALTAGEWKPAASSGWLL